mmetsp:Transcript_28002/g.68065  ORF Transcript_28002/g.68065 Transcript_28002/m.68065 type:complete len:90 (+) Transcript_28002:2772-3041(+)
MVPSVERAAGILEAHKHCRIMPALQNLLKLSDVRIGLGVVKEKYRLLEVASSSTSSFACSVLLQVQQILSPMQLHRWEAREKEQITCRR